MTSFIRDNTALFDDKTDLNPSRLRTRESTAADWQLVKNALLDTRTALQESANDARNFGVVGDGVADDTAELQAAIDASVGRTLYLPRGKYKVTSTLFITERSTHIVGDFPNRNTENGTEISYTGTGPCIQLHTDSGNPWSNNEYNGKQDHIFEYLCIRHGAPDTALIASGGVTLHVKLGAYGIWDWRGGGITMHRCTLEHFEANFVGVQSDINTFIEPKSNYSKYGIYLGPRSDQNTIFAQESIFCDRAVTIDRASGTRILNGQFVGCGTGTSAHIEIRRGSSNGPFGVEIAGCWFEAHSGGYQGTDILGFVSVGETDGYGTGGSIQSGGGSAVTATVVGCSIRDSKLITFLPATPGHVRHLVSVGRCQQLVVANPTHQPSGALTNLVSIVGIQAASSPTNVETTILIDEVPDTLTDAKLFTNLGGGAPTVTIRKFGVNGDTLSSNVRLGASTAAAHLTSGTVTQTLPANTNGGGLVVQNTTANTGNSTCIRGLHTGTVDTSGGFRTVTAVNASVNATRSAGASSLENTGLLCTALGGQTNRALATLDGDVQLNTTSGATVLNKSLRLVSEISPTQLTANVDNYAPTGFADAAVLILTSDASRDITGFGSPVAGRFFYVFNNGAQDIVLKHDVTSTAANRIIGRGAADTTLTPKTGVGVYYSAALTRHILVGDTL